jgi:hypothetical protein
MFKDETKIRIYAYRLWGGIKDSPQKIEGLSFNKEKWYEIRQRLDKLEKWVRTDENPDGLLELRIYDPNDNLRGNILDDKKIYSSDELIAMKRSDIEKICESWDINTIRRKKDKLIELLMHEFEVEKVKREISQEEELDWQTDSVESETELEDIFNEEPIEEDNNILYVEDETDNILASVEDETNHKDDKLRNYKIGL